MAANTQPIFPISQQVGHAILTTADTSMTAPTTAGATVLTGGVNGIRVDGMKIRALGTNVATVLRVFIKEDNNYFIVHEVTLAATTAATATITGVDTLLLPTNYNNAGDGTLPPYLEPGQSLVAALGTTVAAGYAVTAWGGDY